MARPRKPTKVLELTGAFVKHPERARERAGEPEVTTPLGDPPATLNQVEAGIWQEFAATGRAWLTAAERPLLEMTCQLVHRMRNRLLDTPSMGVLRGCLSDLGFNAIQRSKIKVPEAKKPESRFAGLRRGA